MDILYFQKLHENSQCDLLDLLQMNIRNGFSARQFYFWLMMAKKNIVDEFCLRRVNDIWMINDQKIF